MQKWSDDAFAGYLAGMIDGEGSIEVLGTWSVRIRIANTVRPTLEAMKNRIGFGKVYQYSRPKNKKWKPVYVLEFANAIDMKAIFEICGSFIHIKSEKYRQALAIVDRVLSEAGRIDDRNRKILKAIRSGQMQKQIAIDFGVSPQLISRIKSGHTWSSVIDGHRARALTKKFPRQKDQSFRLHNEA